MALTHRLEIRVNPLTREWLQQVSLSTGKSQGEIAREAIAQIQAASQIIIPKQNPKNLSS